MEIDLTKYTNEQLVTLFDRVCKEQENRKNKEAEKYIKKFCDAMAELIINVPDAHFILDTNGEDTVDVFVDPIPWRGEEYDLDDLSQIINNRIERS